MALSKDDLLWTLQDLTDEDVELFKFYLRQEQQGAAMTYSGIPRGSLQRASRVEMVDLMAEMYTSDLAQITAGILHRMRKFALRQTLLGRTLSSPAAAESVGSVRSLQPVTPDLPVVPAHQLEFITCWSQNKDQMSRILSDLSQIQVQVVMRCQQSMLPTFTATFALGTTMSFIAAPLLPGIALLSIPAVVVGLASYQGLVSAGAAVMYCQTMNQRQDQKDQDRARELETELRTVLEVLVEKLLVLLMSHLSPDTRILVQETIGNIQEVLQTNCGPRPETGTETRTETRTEQRLETATETGTELRPETRTESAFEWISVLTEKGRVILKDLGSVKEKLRNSQNILTS